MAEVKLFRTFSSLFALRIVWALKLKSIEFDTVMEDFPHKSALLLKYNPVHKKVPVFVHNGKPISESLVILEYIEETWKETPLFPEDPMERATARFWAKFGDEKLLTSIFQSVLRKGKEQEEAKLDARKNLEYVEELLRGKRFFGGESIGFLDLVFGWMANLISILEETSGQDIIKEEQCPLLLKWIKDFSEVPVVKESMPPRDKLISKFRALQQA